jgi:hypothetical protein
MRGLHCDNSTHIYSSPHSFKVLRNCKASEASMRGPEVNVAEAALKTVLLVLETTVSKLCGNT